MIPLMVVPTLTRHDLLGAMLDTVDAEVGRLVVIDNSGRGVELPDGPWQQADVFAMPANLGVAASWNLAIRMGFDLPWVMVASDDVLWPAGALDKFAEESGEDRLVVSETWPHWCAFTIGMGVVSELGLFDEGYYPAFYEDKEYERRCADGGVDVRRGPEVSHFNSATLHTPGAGFEEANSRSFHANRVLFESGRHGGFDPFRWRRQAW